SARIATPVRGLSARWRRMLVEPSHKPSVRVDFGEHAMLPARPRHQIENATWVVCLLFAGRVELKTQPGQRRFAGRRLTGPLNGVSYAGADGARRIVMENGMIYHGRAAGRALCQALLDPIGGVRFVDPRAVPGGEIHGGTQPCEAVRLVRPHIS